MKLTCSLCGKPCNYQLLYRHRFTHVGCAEKDYFRYSIPEDYYDRPSEERLAELASA